MCIPQYRPTLRRHYVKVKWTLETHAIRIMASKMLTELRKFKIPHAYFGWCGCGFPSLPRDQIFSGPQPYLRRHAVSRERPFRVDPLSKQT